MKAPLISLLKDPYFLATVVIILGGLGFWISIRF
jgi:hypothetical protein